MIRSFLFIALAGTVACNAQPTPHRSLLALSKTDHTLAVVDPGTLKVVARIPVGEDPHEVIASADGRTAFVSIYGGGSLHELDILDLIAQKPLPALDTRPLFGPHGLVFENGKAWFTAEGSKAVGRYDPATGRLDWSMGTGQDRTHMLYVTPDGRRIYTTNVTSGTVSILIDTLVQPGPPPGAQGSPGGQQPAGAPRSPNPQGPPPGARPHEEWRQTVIPVGRGSEGFDVSPDGRELWTAGAGDGTICIIDLQAKQLSAKLDAGVRGANRLKFTPDGSQVFITSLSSGELTIYDAHTRKEIKQVKTGHGAAGILMDPEGHRAFIACSADNNIAIVDLKTLGIIGHLDVGGVPDGMAWAVQQ
ncbi:MAG TPA: YncE family protein [Puia sp.]|nr:YncE family protein [Puia sp.]